MSTQSERRTLNSIKQRTQLIEFLSKYNMRDARGYCIHKSQLETKEKFRTQEMCRKGVLVSGRSSGELFPDVA